MHYRTGTYVAFDALGKTNPTQSDRRYYALLQAWSENENSTFHFSNSHDRTYKVRDTSQDETLKRRIRERLSCSKNMVVFLSSDTRKNGSWLSYEIEQAVDVHKLPLIIVYTDCTPFTSHLSLCSYWPIALEKRILDKSCRAVHIREVKVDKIEAAINKYAVNKSIPQSSFVLL